MILAFDVYYLADSARTVCIVFENWTDADYTEAIVEMVSPIAEYESGAFYKRELPCILQVLQNMDLTAVTAILIDGYAILDDEGTPGLGAHLYEALDSKIPVIGVAKTNFAQNTYNRVALLRGNSSKLLYITAVGYDMQLAVEHIKTMHGEYRMPTLLKRLDMLTKGNE